MSVHQNFTETIARDFANSYRAKKERWDKLTPLVQELPPEEIGELVGKLLTMLEDQKHTSKALKGLTLMRPRGPGGSSAPALEPPPSSSSASAQTTNPVVRDWDAKPRYADLARAAIKAKGPSSAADIFEYALSIRPDVKKASIDTIVSRMGKSRELLKKKGPKRKGQAAVVLYALP